MALVFNPALTLTRHSDSVILHTARMGGTAYLVGSISAGEAVLLALHDRPIETRDLLDELTSFGYSGEDVARLSELVQECERQGLLVDAGTLKPGTRLRRYDPRDYVAASGISRGRLEAPLGFGFLPTLSCNRSCVYCYAGARLLKREERISLRRLKEVIDEASALGIRSVNISGGEPFLRPDLTEILCYFLSKGIYPDVSTKSKLSDGTLEALRLAGLEDIRISLDAPHRDLANLLAGSESYYNHILSTIRACARHDIRARVNCVVTALNIRCVPDLIDLVSRLGVAEIGLARYSASLGRHSDALYPSLEDVEWLTAMLPTLKAQHKGVSIETPLEATEETVLSNDGWLETPACQIGSFAFVMLPDGSVTFCERVAYNRAFIVGDLRYQTIGEVWASPAWDSLRRPERELYRGSECFECEEFDLCTELGRRCVVRTMAAKGREFAADPACPRARDYQSVS